MDTRPIIVTDSALIRSGASLAASSRRVRRNRL